MRARKCQRGDVGKGTERQDGNRRDTDRGKIQYAEDILRVMDEYLEISGMPTRQQLQWILFCGEEQGRLRRSRDVAKRTVRGWLQNHHDRLFEIQRKMLELLPDYAPGKFGYSDDNQPTGREYVEDHDFRTYASLKFPKDDGSIESGGKSLLPIALSTFLERSKVDRVELGVIDGDRDAGKQSGDVPRADSLYITLVSPDIEADFGLGQSDARSSIEHAENGRDLGTLRLPSAEASSFRVNEYESSFWSNVPDRLTTSLSVVIGKEINSLEENSTLDDSRKWVLEKLKEVETSLQESQALTSSYDQRDVA
jgi:hypothetical protein